MNKVASLVTGLIFSVISSSSNAGLIDFSDNFGDGSTSFSKTITGSGLDVGTIATFNNVKAESFGNDFYLSGGLGLGSGGLGYTWDVSFDKDVTLTGLLFAFARNFTEFDIQGSTVAANDGALATPMTFLAGNSYTFSTDKRLSTGFGGVIFYQWNFDAVTTSVPEPSTLAIFAIGLMGLVARRFKKQS